jgi:threonine aldolase
MGSRLRSLSMSFLPFFRHSQARPLLGKVCHLQNLRSQSTQAVTSPLLVTNVYSDQDKLDDAFSLLRSTSIAWNRPGPAEFDFRSMLTFLYQLCTSTNSKVQVM